MNEKQGGHFVYVVVAESGAAKVGVTSNLQSRLSGIQTGNHESLAILFTLEVHTKEIAFAIERLLHERYGQHRIRGEWFSVDPKRLTDDIRFAAAFARCVRSFSEEKDTARVDAINGGALGI